MEKVISSIENVDEQIKKLERNNIDSTLNREFGQTTKVFRSFEEDTKSFVDEDTPVIVGNIVDNIILEEADSSKANCPTKNSNKTWILVIVLIIIICLGWLFLIRYFR